MADCESPPPYFSFERIPAQIESAHKGEGSRYRCTSAQSEAAELLRDVRRIKVKRAEERRENSQHEYSIKNVRRRRRSQDLKKKMQACMLSQKGLLIYCARNR